MDHDFGVDADALRYAARTLADTSASLEQIRMRTSGVVQGVAVARAGSPLGAAALEFADRLDATLGGTERGLDAAAGLLDGAARSYESIDRNGAAELFRAPPLLPGPEIPR